MARLALDARKSSAETNKKVGPILAGAHRAPVRVSFLFRHRSGNNLGGILIKRARSRSKPIMLFPFLEVDPSQFPACATPVPLLQFHRDQVVTTTCDGP